MSLFFKVGLPWAISLGVVFYVGLTLGSKQDNPMEAPAQLNEETSSHSNNPNQNTDKIVHAKLSSRLSKETNSTSTVNRSRVSYSPPLPPNLRRIMEDGSILERMGAYMDALRGMDINSLGEVVDAFEALPKGYGSHLEMKLLMRIWSNLDPVNALTYAENSLDEKSERRFAMTEVLAGWAIRDSAAAISWVEKYQTMNPDSKNGNNLMVGIISKFLKNLKQKVTLTMQPRIW